MCLSRYECKCVIPNFVKSKLKADSFLQTNDFNKNTHEIDSLFVVRCIIRSTGKYLYKKLSDVPVRHDSVWQPLRVHFDMSALLRIVTCGPGFSSYQNNMDSRKDAVCN